jgi:hypothetical protein
VFDNFQDNETCIKYFFDFANKHKGTLWILTDKDIFYFDDGVDFPNENKQNNHAFFFVRERRIKNKVITIFVIFIYGQNLIQ